MRKSNSEWFSYFSVSSPEYLTKNNPSGASNIEQTIGTISSSRIFEIVLPVFMTGRWLVGNEGLVYDDILLEMILNRRFGRFSICRRHGGTVLMIDKWPGEQTRAPDPLAGYRRRYYFVCLFAYKNRNEILRGFHARRRDGGHQYQYLHLYNFFFGVFFNVFFFVPLPPFLLN